jgi:PKD domain-containing protein/PASTA domain-containing protein
MRRVQLFAFALSVAVLLAAGGAAAEPMWLAPQDLSLPGGNAEAPQVALDSAGDGLAVWYRSNGDGSVIQATQHLAGGGWEPPQDLSAKGLNAYYPQLAVNASGYAVAVWEGSPANGASVVQAAVRPSGGLWGRADDLSPGLDPHVAVASYGAAVAVWVRSEGESSVIQASVRPYAWSWSAPTDISSPGAYAGEPQVAFDGYGNALAVWRRFDGANWIVQAAAHPSGGEWSAPRDLSAPGQDAEAPQVAFDRYGGALAVWRRFDGANWIVQAAFRPYSLRADGQWSAPQDLSAPRHDAGAPHVAFDALFGDAVAIWTRDDDTVQAADRPVGGPWQPAADVAVPGFLTDDARIALDAAGDAIAVWRRSDNGEHGVVQGAERPAGGEWGAPQFVAAFGEAEVQLAADRAGNALAAWSKLSSDGSFVVQAGAFDAAGPVFRGLSVPARASAGRRLRFSVSSFDAWSGLAGEPRWGFGDGLVATGTAVRHTYAKAGSYTVTLRQSDNVGNQSVVSRTISIGAPKCVVPKLVGKSLAKAKAFIARHHCRTGRVRRAFWSQGTKGRVLAQHPRAGTRLPKGAKVDLLVSRGRRA